MRNEWQLKTLDELCHVVRGGSPRPIQDFLTNSPDGVNWIKISDATASGKYIYQTKEKIRKEGVNRSRLVKSGDFILSNSMSFGRPYIMRTTGCVHDGWLVLSDRSGSFDQDYLYHFLSSPNAYNQFDRLAAGSTVRNLNIESVKKVIVPLPPMNEQNRLVTVLNEAFEGIAATAANAEKNLASARELFSSHLNSVFAQKDEMWSARRLEDTVEKTCSLSYGIVQPGDNVNGGLPIVRPTDLHSKTIGLSGLKRINPALADGYKRTKLFGGELLLCVRGGTGSVSIASRELAGSNVTRGIVPIRFDSSVVLEEFGYFAFISKVVQDQIKAATYGAALMQINIRDLRKISLNLPTLEVQAALLGRFREISTEVERLTFIYERKAAALVELKQAILQKAFAGKLTARPEKALEEVAA